MPSYLSPPHRRLRRVEDWLAAELSGELDRARVSRAEAGLSTIYAAMGKAARDTARPPWAPSRIPPSPD